MSHSSEEMDMGKLQQNVRDHLEKVFFQQNRTLLKSEIEKNDMRKKLEHNEAWKEEVRKMYARNESQKKELRRKHEESEAEKKELQKKLDQSEAQKKEVMNEQCEAEKKELKILMKQLSEKATIEKGGAEEKMLELKNENEELHLIIIEFEKLIDQHKDQALVKDAKHKEMDEFQEKLKEKEEELAEVEALNNTLIVKECKSNDELQEARKALINGWESSNYAFIGVKRMGELDNKPFRTACKRKYPKDEADDQAVALCSLWEEYLRDSSWNPFTTSMDYSGEWKQTINEEDENLKNLEDEFGDEVYNAVATALVEMSEYNPSGRYTIRELWNFQEGRRASLKEGVMYLLNQLKLQKRRRR